MRTFASAGPTPGEIAMLLPWYAAGTLGRRTAAQVEAALAHDIELGRQYEFIREELTETIHLNESLGVPTARAGDRLAAALVAEADTTAGKNSTLARWRRWGGWLAELSPRALKWSATMAALALALQAGLIVELSSVHRGAREPGIASFEESASAKDAYAYVRFAPEASSSEITKYLRGHRAQVVDGPRADGIYKIRVAAGALSEADVAEVVQDIRQPNSLVHFMGMTAK
jgi:anti-sigma-K factor RskA